MSSSDKQSVELLTTPFVKFEEVSKALVTQNILAITAALFLFSYIGAFIRVSLQSLFLYIGPVISVVSPQFVGCIIMGMVIILKKRIEPIAHSLFVGLGTGLCGSITSFSGVILAASKQFFNVTKEDKGIIQNIMAGLVVYLFGFGMSFLGYILGRYIGHWLDKSIIKTKSPEKLEYSRPVWFVGENTTKMDTKLITIGILSGVTIFVMSLFLAKSYSIMYVLLFAPFGTLIRRWFSKLNAKVPDFPIGTFIVNVFGSGFLAVLYLLPGIIVTQEPKCYIFIGLMDGFCGCLTTISTWVVEIYDAKRNKGHFYGGLSIVVAQILQILIFVVIKGSYENLCI